MGAKASKEVNYKFMNERTERIFTALMLKFPLFSKIKLSHWIQNRDITMVQLSFIATNFEKRDHCKVYEELFNIISENYENLNDFFIPNLKNQQSFFYILVVTKNYDLLLRILEVYADALRPTFNVKNQQSILHSLSLCDEKFNQDQKKIFRIVLERTHEITRNNLQRSFVETAIAQNSPNLNYIISQRASINSERSWVIVKYIITNYNLKRSLLGKVLKHSSNQEWIRPKYLKMLEKHKASGA
ncbi:unnamed protein product [Moneuplotes crassus]|uniref:Uncharacterized protein n=1 Tax=Euplotes crassus TaxID=5936 RepID=A0AAD1XXX9_EUPCR|nr:unnamed protein product [Moneuplotes crassus]